MYIIYSPNTISYIIFVFLLSYSLYSHYRFTKHKCTLSSFKFLKPCLHFAITLRKLESTVALLLIAGMARRQCVSIFTFAKSFIFIQYPACTMKVLQLANLYDLEPHRITKATRSFKKCNISVYVNRVFHWYPIIA